MERFLTIPDIEVFVVIGILFVFSTFEIIGGLLQNTKRSKQDWLIEIACFLSLALLIKPGIFFLTHVFGVIVFPGQEDVFSGSSLWIILPVYLLVDDLLQYWYHRMAHENPWLWKFHRVHHTAEEMGLLVSYRNAAMYFALMPNIWWIGFVLFLGGGKAVILGIMLKQLIVIGSHSTTKWDQVLYKYSFLHPVAWIVERFIITPATHFAHHGKSKKDGISDPNGNYGNMFFIWDQLFDTAIITRKYPNEFGIPDDPKDSWVSQWLYPLVKSDNPASELSDELRKSETTSLSPVELELEKGKYLWCTCGMSKTQPFCDGSHQGSKFKPLLFELKKKSKVKLCQCKLSKKGPFCDQSHLEVAQIPELSQSEVKKLIKT